MQGVESEFELLYVALHQARRLAPSHLDRPPTLQADGLLAAFWSPRLRGRGTTPAAT